jgi:hypothetical protein
MKPVSETKFISNAGFTSPGFEVDELGNIEIKGSISFSGELVTSNPLSLNEVALFDNGKLASSITDSSLTSVGVLNSLSVEGDTSITGNVSINGNVEAGALVISDTSTFNNDVAIKGNTSVNGDLVQSTGSIMLSSLSKGSIDNIDLGSTTPGSGDFTALTVTESADINPANTGRLDNINIGSRVRASASFSNVDISDKPIEPTAGANKNYVDNTAAALSIALGS